ncbi:response regulator [Flammeovirga yaeyamensis]|uniref:Response regulator n=1 Tax=Flammeovirga yaeyamensis TaxID=367791 RepID=A0AAX1N4B3_9BACT|nr:MULTISPECIES: response regulator [Flammeovirga]ANQ50283.1 response regulator [Flammeovirga sp. MY04]MBB3699768.1 CheY-like chemotaxis protein [Flammeovirga yaeyamensis]NMF36663.1 response regulator [Flammeovirga yaeyamensis]QWG02292.1 response regulator [Flammeovirga yaeyamensis]
MLLKNILLIDDSESISFFNQLIIEQANITEKCTMLLSGEKGLEYLQEYDKEKYPLPEIILLDINMPRMNGWEFIEEFDQLDKSITENITLFMLTTSTNKDDKDKALTYSTVKGYLTKPLTEEQLNQVLEVRSKQKV